MNRILRSIRSRSIVLSRQLYFLGWRMMTSCSGVRRSSLLWTKKSIASWMFTLLSVDGSWMPTLLIFTTYSPNFHPLHQKRSHPCSREPHIYFIRHAAYDGTESLAKRAVSNSEIVNGPMHPDTATSLNNLADLYYKPGQIR